MDINEEYENILCESDSDSGNGSESIKSKPTFLDKMNEEELEEFHQTIEENINTYLEENILKFSKENFTATMIQEIARETFEYLHNAEICEIGEEEIIEEYVEEMVEHIYEIHNIPPRSEMIFEEIEYTDDEIEFLREKLKNLQELPQPAQRSPEWYSFRRQLFTASNLFKLFSTEAKYNSLIYEKCCPVDENSVSFGMTNTTSPAHWGVKYEPISSEIYKIRNQVELVDLGCIQHPKYSFIGASPDGLVVSHNKMGRMLEIKNPTSRVIDGIPIEDYWIQMQLQMEVCDLDECDFLETQFREYETETEFWEDIAKDYIGDNETENRIEKKEKGVLLLIMEDFGEMGHIPIPKYRHFPLDEIVTKENVENWIQSVTDEVKEKESLRTYQFTPIYWRLETYSCVLVRRNRVWFESALPKIEEAWKTVVKEREEGYEHRAPKKKIKSLSPALLIDVHKLPAEYEFPEEPIPDYEYMPDTEL